MNGIVAATLLIAFVGAVSAGGEGCCTPDQWQGFQGTATGYSGPKPALVSTSVQLFYDATNSRVAANASVIQNGKTMYYFVLLRNDKQCKDSKLNAFLKGDDCNQEKMYVVDLQTSKCYVKEAHFRKACVPKEAQFTGNFAFGGGSDTLKAKSFSLYTSPKPGTSVSYWITVTDRDCIPVGVSSNGLVNGVGFMETGGYFNLKLSIDDPSVFNIPAQCKSAIPTELPEAIKHIRSPFFL